MPSAAKMYLPGVGPTTLYNSNGEEVYIDYQPGDVIEPEQLENFNLKQDSEVTEVNNLFDIVNEELSEVANEETGLQSSKEIEIYDTPYKYFAVTLHGGRTDTGYWSNYFNTLSDFLNRLESIFEDAWVIKVDVNTEDSVFDIKIGVKPAEG